VRKIIILNIILVFIFLSLSFAEENEVVKITPHKPKEGDKIQIIYNSAFKNSIVRGEDLYLIYWVIFHNDASTHWTLLEKEGMIYLTEISVPLKAQCIHFYFITKEKFDRKNSKRIPIYGKDENPVRGGYLGKEDWENELKLYPDNYYAYKLKWMILNYEKKQEANKIIKDDLKKIESIKEKDGDILFILFYGYTLIGEEREGKFYLLKLAEKFPSSFRLMEAFLNYDYFAYLYKFDQAKKDEVNKIELDFMSKNPKSKFTRKILPNAVYKMDIKVKLMEKIIESWIKEEENDPMPYFLLGNYYADKKMKLSEAEENLNRFIDLALKSYLRFYHDVSGALTERYIFRSYQKIAEIKKEKKDYVNALSYCNAALEFAGDESIKSSVYLLKGSIWEELRYKEKTEKNYFLSLKAGEKEAEKKLFQIYKKYYGTEEGFEEYMKKRKQELFPTMKEGLKPAPEFGLESLEGRKIELSELKGKVVVLNFWGTGCAPCKVEIPQLNKLVDEYKDKNVVFLAISSDSPEVLRKFLKKRPFSYQIMIDKGGKAFKAYNKIEAIPVHFIIDKKGFIRFSRLGGGEKIKEILEIALKGVLE